ncbi:hypothetical protein BDV37DRAFT_239284 [Aspergillus pseudonomiae]|uniref:Uncharacterized protein n=1 Tax=Aspergillus pseudonomiae TaxID=1506151 RepID=A0A5N7DP79_9EURO|nr:uncharacterized protein BDV37DRAFT_239284 [Aspergillus pseudonomiae]KAE8408277.1 hypothetical protein BDV37DRAFT_239284 [Aspergillus pseudonomiae]
MRYSRFRKQITLGHIGFVSKNTASGVHRMFDETLKAAFRPASSVTLSDGFDLEHIYKDQPLVLISRSPYFFVI